MTEAFKSRQTLGNKPEFNDATKWAPVQKLGYVYSSEAMMKKMFVDAKRAVDSADDVTKSAYALLSKEARPITYVISSESPGVLHELRLPKNMVMTLVTAAAADMNKSPLAKNEDVAISELRSLISAQYTYREDHGQEVSERWIN
ncbi:MAG: hypothetical protein WKF84_02375 [Pyrinomonadaceae bacterium]